MTFSIVACDLELGDWGVAVASKFPAVGSVVPWAKAGVGAVATQSRANVEFGPDGLALMAQGRPATEALDALVAGDEERAGRQVGAVDRNGVAATFTGEDCVAWAGGAVGDPGEGFACQGNILTGPEVVSEMARAYREAGGELVDRLLEALAAGEAAGGDRRGKQSAAILVVRAGSGYGGRNDRYIDLRVDDHPEALKELVRVFRAFDTEYLVRNDSLVEPTPALIAELQSLLTETGHYAGAATGDLDSATRTAIEEFAGRYNLEAKIVWEQQRLYESVIREIREVAAVPPAKA